MGDMLRLEVAAGGYQRHLFSKNPDAYSESSYARIVALA